MRRRVLSLAAAALLAFPAAAALGARAPSAGAPAGRVVFESPVRPEVMKQAVAAGVATADPGSFAADPPGPEATPAPRPDEWKEAPPIRLTHDVDACRAYRVREWVKIHCAGFPAAGVSLLAGTRTGVELWVDPPRDPGETMKTARSAEVMFPVRRGDGRLFQVAQFGEGYDGPVAWNLALTVSEQWIEGESAPIVTVR